MKNKLEPIEAVIQFIEEHFSNGQGVILAGSVEGQGTEASDLDIVVFDKSISSSYRESFVEFGWNIEVFVHNLSS